MITQEQIDEGIEYYNEHGCSKASAARYLIKKYGLTENQDNVRVQISHKIATENKVNIGLEKICDEQNINVDDVSNYWYKGEHHSIHVRNKAEEKETLLAELKSILDDWKPNFEKVQLRPSEPNCQKALKATISDMHVGLEPNKNNNSIFKYEYNAEIFNQNIDNAIQSIIKEYNTHGRFEKVIIQDLGDGQDGWGNKTTRQNHDLEQNLGNVGQFKTYVFGKLRLAESVINLNIADKVEFKTVANCNHAGEFGEISNISIQAILERVYDSSLFEFYIQPEFLNHFEYGDHTFLMTHGKDKEHMKHGLPKHLDAKTEKFIQSYIEHYEITSKYIHFEKGDLHCSCVDRSKKFDYRNFMSFAPPSGWVQTNYGDTYSGYSIQVIPKHAGHISHADYIFEFKKGKKIV